MVALVSDFTVTDQGVATWTAAPILYVFTHVITGAAQSETFDDDTSPSRINRTGWWVVEQTLDIGAGTLVYASLPINWIDFTEQAFILPPGGVNSDRIRYHLNYPAEVRFIVFEA